MVHATDNEASLSTSRLLLRPVDPEADAPEILRMRMSPQVTEYIHPTYKPIPSLQFVQDRLSERNRDNIVYFALELRPSPVFPPNKPLPAYPKPTAWAAHAPPTGADDAYINREKQTLIGTVGITNANELGYVIDEPWWGMGLATEAAMAAIAEWERRSHVATGGGEINAMINPVNVGSARVLEKCGFERDGVHEVDDWYIPGKKIELWKYRYRTNSAHT